MSLTPSLYALTARARGVPLGTGRGSLSSAPAAGRSRRTAAPSRTAIHHRFRFMFVSSTLTPARLALALREHLPRAGKLRPRSVGLRTDRGELLEMPSRSHAVAREFGREACAVQAAEAVRLLGDRGLVLRQRFGGPAELQQQVTEEFARRHDRSRGHHVLLGLILMVGGGAHRGGRLLVLAFGAQ